MKKSLLALAALTAFAGAASAQSNVTLYGRVDLSFNERMNRDGQAIENGSGSRLGLRGSEDLGGGLAAVFNIEHRFNADTGISQGQVNVAGQPVGSSVRFWSARSIVGLKGGWGQVVLGREYTTAFLGSQLINDPWGWDTVAADATAQLTGAGIAKVRNDSAITYNLNLGGFSFGAQYAEATDDGGVARFQDNPYNFSAGWAGGPFSVNFGYEVTGEQGVDDAKVLTIGGAFNFGSFKLGGSYADGNFANGLDSSAWMITGTAAFGQGEFRAMYGEREIGNTKDIKSFAIGYHYALSKRTTIYTDYVTNSELNNNKNGYDFGIKHNF
jgi:predicted porin